MRLLLEIFFPSKLYLGYFKKHQNEKQNIPYEINYLCTGDYYTLEINGSDGNNGKSVLKCTCLRKV